MPTHETVVYNTLSTIGALIYYAVLLFLIIYLVRELILSIKRRLFMNKNDIKILNNYAQAIFGCDWDDLSDKEQAMLKAHVREREPEFENHFGV